MLKFEKMFTLRASDFDCRKKLQSAAILDLFQNVAGEHAEQLGIGYEDCLKKNALWVVVKVKYQVVGDARLYQPVKVKTWPLPPSRVSFQREYLIEDTSGNPLVLGTSEWVLMNSQTRRLMSVKDVYPEGEEFCTCRIFPERLFKVPEPETVGMGHAVCPVFTDLDMNGHVNNTKYANYVLNLLDLIPGELVDTLQIDYHREVREKEELRIHLCRTGQEILAKGLSCEGERMFSCRIALK